VSDNRIHLVVGTPAYGGQVHTVYTASMLKLQYATQKRQDVDLTVLMPSGDALIPRARQDLVAHFLGIPTATHLLFVDSDIGFEPDQVFRFLTFGAEIMAGVYPTKRVDWERVSLLAAEGRKPLDSTSLSYVMEFDDPERIASKGGFARVKFAGTGFLMIRRDVLTRMLERYSDLKYTRQNQAEDTLKGSPNRCALFNCMIDQATGTYLSEDYSFCRRWTDMGGEIWADLESRLTHVGPMAFRGNVATQFGLVDRASTK
jgi:hypothetical protein